MDFSVQILAISTVLAVVLWYTSRRVRGSRYKTEKGLRAPEPSGALPIIGHLHLLGKQMTLARTFAAMADKYGPIFTIRLGKYPTVVVSNHEAIKECFTTHDRSISSRPRSSTGEYLGYNYAAFGFTNSGPFWRDMRKIVSIQLLSSHRLKSLRHVQVSEVNSLINDLYLLCRRNKQGSARIVISECFERLTINMITRMIAGKRYLRSTEAEKEEEGKRIGKLMKEYMYISGVIVPSDLIPFLGWMNHFPGPVKTMKRLSRELDSLMESWIQEHKLKRLESTTENTSKMEGDDFIDVMLSLLDDSMFGYSRETIIKATAMTLIIAAADTTSIALTWILSNLLNHRRSLQLAQEELDLKVGRERWAEDSDIENLVYIQAIIKETLRLYPPGPLSAPHEATEDFCVAGYHISKGTWLFSNLWKLHRDPNLWSNPDEYMPERFLTDQANVEVLGHHFELIPFGSGRRSCPGITFALQLLHLTLARLLQGFDMKTPTGESVDMTEGSGVTLPKMTPLEILITPRLSPELYSEC
ncbi:cytochrome P450 [Salix suchowensis]|nr:cytochrome P450 [Salix suchowensis]